MRQIIVLEFISLDGVIQAPGGPKEDTSGDFDLGGWTAHYGDEVFGNIIQKQMEPADLLLGRKTFEIWEFFWPKNSDHWPKINEVKKYVLSNTRNNSEWNNSVFLQNLEDIGKSGQCDHPYPVEVDHPYPEQTDQANPEQIDHPISCL